MENLLTLVELIILFIIIVFYCEFMIRRTVPKNKVHFYVTCETNHRGEMIHTLWIGKPYYTENKGFVSSTWSSILAVNDSFVLYNLNHYDFENMKNGDIREVFIKMED